MDLAILQGIRRLFEGVMNREHAVIVVLFFSFGFSRFCNFEVGGAICEQRGFQSCF